MKQQADETFAELDSGIYRMSRVLLDIFICRARHMWRFELEIDVSVVHQLILEVCVYHLTTLRSRRIVERAGFD